jgi:hypothetical protein
MKLSIIKSYNDAVYNEQNSIKVSIFWDEFKDSVFKK